MKIFLIGYMGCGKSSIGKKLATKLQMGFVDLDDLIVEQQKKNIETIFETEGEEAFRKYEQSVLHTLEEKENIIIATGGGTPCFFDNMEWMNRVGETVFLNPSVNYLFNRVLNSSKKRPLLEGISDRNLHQFIKNNLKKRLPYYQKAKHHISGLTIQVNDLIQLIVDIKKN